MVFLDIIRQHVATYLTHITVAALQPSRSDKLYASLVITITGQTTLEVGAKIQLHANKRGVLDLQYQQHWCSSLFVSLVKS